MRKQYPFHTNLTNKRRLRVLVVATSRKTRGGITSVIKAHEASELWKRFHCHWVQTHRDGPVCRKILYFISSFIDFAIRLPFYDIVHLHISQPVTIRRKYIFLRLAKKLHKRVIIHFHAVNIEDTFGGACAKKYIDFFNKADKVIVLSNWWKLQIYNDLSIHEDNIIVLYNPCPVIHNDKKNGKEKIILYAGTVNKRKGYADLIKAFARIASIYPDWRVVFAGNGEIEEGILLARELGIVNQIEFAGWVSGNAKDSIFRKASIFCLPSYAEGFPMAVLDAWAYGLPVITTPVGGIPDIAIDGENMLLFNPGDIDTLAFTLDSLIKYPELRNKLSIASIDLAKTTFNKNNINHQLEDIYNSFF